MICNGGPSFKTCWKEQSSFSYRGKRVVMLGFVLFFCFDLFGVFLLLFFFTMNTFAFAFRFQNKLLYNQPLAAWPPRSRTSDIHMHFYLILQTFFRKDTIKSVLDKNEIKEKFSKPPYCTLPHYLTIIILIISTENN